MERACCEFDRRFSDPRGPVTPDTRINEPTLPLQGYVLGDFLRALDPEGDLIYTSEQLDDFFVPRDIGLIPTVMGLAMLAVLGLTTGILAWLGFFDPLNPNANIGIVGEIIFAFTLWVLAALFYLVTGLWRLRFALLSWRNRVSLKALIPHRVPLTLRMLASWRRGTATLH
tara:strand:+ start:18333 stop:18845 length:513 start_codon:yes stop_codon:yes gene_type:complete